MNDYEWLESLRISLPDKSRDWGALARKISAGKLLEDAAAEAGIPLVEAIEHLQTRREAAELADIELRMLASTAFQAGIERLVAISQEAPRVKSEGSEFSSVTFAMTDLEAARALVTAGVSLARLARERAPAGSAVAGERDLFDAPPQASNWSFKKRD